ncbi:pre-16S rRNA-processing nuclease YqgF [symbiont of Argiope bruennichi]|uniref:RuvX/YqgF family protein n=1 Tax=symbiont of Argiope bruennichi TaxID=2810479 RepID=UPI003DA45D6A
MIIGLDLGKKTLGIAVSYDYKLVLPSKTVFYQEGDFLLLVKKIKEIFFQEKIETIVLGLSFRTDKITETTKMIYYFYFLLKNHFQATKIVLENENYTTKEIKSLYRHFFPKKYLKKFRAAKDSSSAVLILENYLAKNLKK